MIPTLPYKTKQFFGVLIKLSIVVGAFYFITQKLLFNDALEWNEFIAFSHKNNLFSFTNVFILLFLSAFNWYFDILKWQTLVSSVTPISFNKATEQSLAGLTASLLTPNRIGDYGIKAVQYPKFVRKKIILLNLIGNMTQMATTTLFGIVGLLFFINKYPLDLNFKNLSLLISAAILICVFIFSILNTKRFRIKGFSLRKIYQFISSIPIDIKIKNLLFSMVRYLIFSFQFYVLLILFGISINYLSAMVVITTMYFLSSIIPSIFIFDVVIKGSVAVYLFSIIGVNNLTVLCIVTLMWLLNFVIPSVIGSYYVLNFRLSNVKQPA